MKRNYKQFYALLSKCGLQEEKKALVSQFSDGRTESLKELTDKEFEDLVAHVEGSPLGAFVSTLIRGAEDKQRKKLIAIMCERGFTRENTCKMDVPDMPLIYDWVTNNPKSCMKGKNLNSLTKYQLSKLITQVSSIKEWYEEQESIKEILK